MKFRMRLRRRRGISLFLGACALMVAAPTAGALPGELTNNNDLRSPDARDAAVAAEQPGRVTYTDLRSPDARDAAVAAEQRAEPVTYSDLRSPDARDAAVAAEQPGRVTYTDLRSPDTRDAARGITPGSRSAPVAAPATPRTVVSVEEGGSQTLAIVFSSTALLIALLAVGFVAVSRRPRPRWTAP